MYLDQQPIDTTTPMGQLVFQLTGAFAATGILSAGQAQTAIPLTGGSFTATSPKQMKRSACGSGHAAVITTIWCPGHWTLRSTIGLAASLTVKGDRFCPHTDDPDDKPKGA